MQGSVKALGMVFPIIDSQEGERGLGFRGLGV